MEAQGPHVLLELVEVEDRARPGAHRTESLEAGDGGTTGEDDRADAGRAAFLHRQFVELAAQVAGPLCEDVTLLRFGLERGAVLGMVRRALFLRPCFLPTTVRLTAQVRHADSSRVTAAVTAVVGDATVFRAELIIAMIEVPPESSDIATGRHERLARWKHPHAT